MGLLGFQVFRFVRRIEGDQLTLRLLRLRDLFILRSTFLGAALRSETGSEPLKYFGFLASLWRWLRSTFQVLYVVERKRGHGHRVIGIIGLYDLSIGNRTSLSTFLFDPRDRGQGYGRESVRLLLDFLETACVAKEVYVEVVKGNLPSLRLFHKMGFKMMTSHSDGLVMAKKLGKDDAPLEPI